MTTDGVRLERHGPLVVLRLDKARGNAIDGPMVEALAAAVEEIAADETVRGVLLASAHPKLFCPGLDLVTLVEYDHPAMERFFARFEDAMIALYSLRKPVVAAVGGAAVAGGCILALTADLRLLRSGSLIGLNEVRLGVPLPGWVATLVRTSISPAAFTRVGLLGQNFTDEEAREAGPGARSGGRGVHRVHRSTPLPRRVPVRVASRVQPVEEVIRATSGPDPPALRRRISTYLRGYAIDPAP